MRSISLFLAFIAAAVASPVAIPQGVTQAVSPSASPPPGCSGSFPTSFGISVMNLTTSDVTKRDVDSGVAIFNEEDRFPTLLKRNVKALATATTTADSSSATVAPHISLVGCKSDSSLELTLSDGIIKDEVGRTGYIASNYQFQFDNPPQSGAIYTAGWSICANGSLALGGSNIFYECLSGSFYNLYNMDWAPQCSPITINALNLIDCS